MRRASSVAALIVLTVAGASAAQEPQQTRTAPFLRLNDGQRYWWFEGAIRSVSHLVGLRDKQKGECISNWYLGDRDAKRKLVEDAIAKYPDAGETTILLGLLQQACGKLPP